MAEPIRPTNIEALIEGGVGGQVAVGSCNVRIHADHGAVVHFVPPEPASPTPAELVADDRSVPVLAVASPGSLDQLAAEERRMVAILAGAEGAPVGIDPLREIAGPDAGRILGRLVASEVVQADGPHYSLRVELDEAVRQAWQVELWQEKLWERLTAWAERNPDRIHEEAASLRQAVDSAAAAERWEIVRRLGRAIEGQLAIAGRWAAWGLVIERVLTACERLRNVPGRAWALHQRGTRSLCPGDPQAAREDLTQALQIRESIGDVAGAAVTRHNLGLLLAPPPASPNRPAASASRGFPHLLAWLILPALLILLVLVVGGKTLLSRAPESDPEPSAENPAVTEAAEAGEKSPPPDRDQEEPDIEPAPTSTPVDVPVTTDLSVEIPVDVTPEEEAPADPTEPEPAGTTEPEPPESAAARLGCCVDGVFQIDMTAEECTRLEGIQMAPGEAPTRCESPGQEAEGWCCVAQDVFPSTAAYCESNGGGFGRTRRQARRRCTNPEREP